MRGVFPTGRAPAGAKTMARKTKAETERTRRRILNAALDLFIEKGYERMTFEDVGRRIGLSKGAVFWHFKTKTDLLVSLVDAVAERREREEGRSFRTPASAGELVDDLVRAASATVAGRKSRKFFIMMNRLDWISPKMKAARRLLAQKEASIFAVIARSVDHLKALGEVREDAETRGVALVAGSVWLGLLKARLCGASAPEAERALRMGLGWIFEGIAAGARDEKRERA